MLQNLLLGLLLLSSTTAFAQNSRLSDRAREVFSKRKESDSVEIAVTLSDTSKANAKMNVLYQYIPSHTLVARMRLADVKELLLSRDVLFINIITQPKEELTTGAVDYTLNKINYAQNRYPQINGDSVSAIVKERLFDTSDIDLKNRVFATGLESANITAHAGLMATIIAGAGNSSPFAKGAAPGALVGSTSFDNLLPDPDAVFQQHNISVQNHSYGTTVENFYGSEAMAYDVSANNNPTLLHVFSAGNLANITSTAGPYANVQEMANLSGNFKQAKNIITVSAVDSLDGVLLLSSKGPAYDGRVKPELVAYGEDGSSGAAALVSGSAVLVEDVYKRAHGGVLPRSFVTKAVLINSADDVGAANVDYVTGYGSLNAFRAVETVSENRFIESSLVPNQVKSYTINVPANIARLKLTLVWNDVAAPVNATKALVNDLDATLRLPVLGQSWLPWVLNPLPNKDSLLLPAQRKRDTLNNVEQISIDNPVAGAYVIEVKGTSVGTPNQTFAVAYQFDTAGVFRWTYPTGTDPLTSGRRHTLRWETTMSGAAQISYATNGNNWRPVATIPDVSTPNYRWTLPDTITTAVLRMTIGSASYVSDTFTISQQPQLQAGFNCVDSFLLYWNSLGVTQFQLYQLGDKYLQPFLQTPDTTVILKKTQHPSIYYAVSPIINNRLGIRSNTLNYSPAPCYLRSFYLQGQTATVATFFAELGTLYNVAEVSLEKQSTNGFVTVQTTTSFSSTDFIFTDNSLTRGENHYRLRIRLSNGVIIYSSIETVYFASENEPVVIYPNPVKQNTQAKITTIESGRFSIRVLDVNGRVVNEQVLNSSRTYLNTEMLSKGMYFIQITDRDHTLSTQKLVVF